MSHYLNKQAVAHVAAQLKSYGYIVYVAERGTHGFYTDGKQVVSFQGDFGMVSFSGNYKPVRPDDGRRIGRGWQMSGGKELSGIDAHTAECFIKAGAPRWASGDCPVTYTTPEQYLKFYESSAFVLFEPTGGPEAAPACQHGHGFNCKICYPGATK